MLWPPIAKSWLTGKDPDARRDWGQEEKGTTKDDQGWDAWMASPTRWTWVCVNSGSWWWTGRHGVLWFTESQRVGHNWATELNPSCNNWLINRYLSYSKLDRKLTGLLAIFYLKGRKYYGRERKVDGIVWNLWEIVGGIQMWERNSSQE